MFRVTSEKIDPNQLATGMADPGCGGFATFTGLVRNTHLGRDVLRLSYEAYQEMAERVFQELAIEAKEKFGVSHVQIVHRVGTLEIGDAAVWIGVLSGHRREAFQACEYCIDELKKRAPIWKKEHYKKGESEWVRGCLIPQESTGLKSTYT